MSVLVVSTPQAGQYLLLAQRDAAKCEVATVYRAPGDRAGRIQFTESTERWGASVTGMLGHAVAASDVDGDGWTDLFVGGFADRPAREYEADGVTGPVPDRLLLGGPDGFDVDDAFGGEYARTSGAAFADLDGDTRPDLVIARNVRDVERGRTPTEILRNLGGGRFKRVATFEEPRGARSIGLFDYDADGYLDLFVAEDRWAGGSSVLLHNDGAFRFSDATSTAGLPRDIVGMGVATADLSGDGSPDLFVGGSNRIFVNDGSGHFVEGRSSTFRWKAFGPEDDPAGVAAGDLNRDGRIDLVVGQHYGSTVDFDKRVPIRLYLNEGNDSAHVPMFRDVSAAAGLFGLPNKAPHVAIADFDQDGWPDILTSAAVDENTPLVFRSLGQSHGIVRFAPTGQASASKYWVSAVVFDADHDGRLDVVLVEFDARRPTLSLRNTGAVGHWLGVRAATGSRVDVSGTGGRGRAGSRLSSLAVGVSTGFGAGDPPVAWFGLGEAQRVDVRVTSPEGQERQLRSRAVDSFIDMTCRARGPA